MAVVTSLGCIEHVADGAIGGFVSLVVMDSRNRATFYECQEGGVSALFGNASGVIEEKNLPVKILESKRAGLISSGPYRPCPLARFLAWDDCGNIVSGHRFPQSPIKKGIALNQAVLTIIQKHGAQSAEVKQLLTENNHLDAGIIAVDANDTLMCEDTQRVMARNDTARMQVQAKDFSFGITMNSIQPSRLIAPLLASKLNVKLQSASSSTHIPCISLNKRARILAGVDPLVEVDSNHHVVSIVTPETCWFETHSEGALLETGTPIVHNGRTIGTILEEPYTTASNGVISALSGKDEMTLRYLVNVAQTESIDSSISKTLQY